MTIAFQCGCGKAYKVKDELAGKRVKCTVCGKVLEVPSSEPQLNDLKSFADDPFAALPPLQSAPLTGGLGQGPPLQSPLGKSSLGNVTSPASAGGASPIVPPSVWIAAGGAGVAVLMIVGIVALQSMGNGKVRSDSKIVSSTRVAPDVASPPAKPASNATPPPPAPASASRPEEVSSLFANGWQLFRSEEGEFAVMFPGEPQRRVDQRSTPRGTLVLSTDFVANPSFGLYSVGHSKNPKRVSNPMLHIAQEARNASAGMAAGTGGKIIESRKINLRGAASDMYIIECTKNGTTLRAHAVFILTKDRFFSISWMGLPGTQTDADIIKFMSSFTTNE